MNTFEINSVIRLSVRSASDQQISEQSLFIHSYLGGGASSAVWLVETVDLDTMQLTGQQMALKVIHEGQEYRWRTEFRDEYHLLRTLWQREEDMADGVHVIPRVYGASEDNTAPFFMLMEYVPFPSVDRFASLYLGLQSELADLKSKIHEVDVLRQHLLSVLCDAGQSIQLQGKHVDEQQWLRELAHQIEKYEQAGQLSDDDLVLIGQRVARVLQLLHESGRFYKDFQLANIHWDPESKQVKMIDWNVVSPLGAVDLELKQGMNWVQQDIFRLASSLYWLRTLAMVPVSGATALELERLGGIAWRDNTGLALRLVLEKALSAKAEEHYEQAYLWEEAQSKSGGLAQCESLGGALSRIAQWSKSSAEGMFSQLMEEVERSKKEMLWTETQILLHLVEAAIDKMSGNEGIRQQLHKTVDEQRLSIIVELHDGYEKGQRLLRSGDYRGAIDNFDKLQKERPDDVVVERWRSVCQLIYDAQIGVDAQGYFWENDALIRFLQALEQQKWAQAEEILNSLKAGLKIDKFGTLDTELAIGRLMEDMQQLTQELALLAPGNELTQTLKKDIAGKINCIKELAEALPYFSKLQENAWPLWPQWQKMIEDHKEQAPDAKEIDELLADLSVDSAENFRRLQLGLLRFSGNRRLWQSIYERCLQSLKAKKPEQAMLLASILLKEGGVHPQRPVIKNLWQVAHLWHRLHQSLRVKDWRQAKALGKQLEEDAKVIPDVDMASLIYEDVAHFTGTNADAGIIDNTQRSDFQNGWKALSDYLENQEILEWQERLQKLLKSDDSQLDSALQMLKSWQQVLPEGVQVEACDAKEKLERSRKMARITQYRRNAEMAEKAGDADYENPEQAQKNYDEAIKNYQRILRNSNDQTVRVPCQMAIERLKSKKRLARKLASGELETTNTLLTQCQAIRKKVEGLLRLVNETGAELASKPASLTDLAHICMQLICYEELPKVRNEINEALVLAEKCGWTKDDFWQAGQPSRLTDALEVLQARIQDSDGVTIEDLNQALDVIEQYGVAELPNREAHIKFCQDQMLEAIDQLWRQRGSDSVNLSLVWKVAKLHDLRTRIQSRETTDVESLVEQPSSFQDTGEALQWLQRHANVSSLNLLSPWFRAMFPSRQTPVLPFPPFERSDTWLDKCQAWLEVRGQNPRLTTADIPDVVPHAQDWMRSLQQELAIPDCNIRQMTALGIRIARLQLIIDRRQEMNDSASSLEQGDTLVDDTSPTRQRGCLWRLTRRLLRKRKLLDSGTISEASGEENA